MANGTRWIPVGPAPEDASGFGVSGGVSGRVWTIAVSSDFDGKGTPAMYIGISGGGIWRSVDFHTPVPTWTPLLDHFPSSFPVSRVSGLSDIGALAVDPNHPSVIYAGSGDPDDRGPNIYGQGMMKSSDGGATWQLLNVLDNPFSPGFCRIFVDPTDGSGSTVYAAGGFGPGSPLRGIFKSTDAGASWSVVEVGIPNEVAIHDLDLEIDGDGRLILFAALTDAAGNNPSANGIWQSINGGASWTQMPIAPLTDLASGKNLTQTDIGLIKLAVDRAPGAPSGAFAAISTGNALMNVFKLAGGVWLPTGANGLRAINTTSAQAIGIAPNGQVFVAGVNDARQNGIYRSTDGGASWQSIDVGANGVRPHTDHHAWAFDGGLAFNGNDGGVWVFDPGPQTWNSLNTSSLQTILTQGIGIHPQYANVMLEGSQDNGVALRASGRWSFVTGGDDGRCKFDPFDSRFAYRTGVSDFNFFFRSDDGGITWPDDRSVQGEPAVQDFAPFNFHPTQPGRMVLVLDRVFETRNRGDDLWKAISGQLAGANGFGGAVAYGGDDILYAALAGRLFSTKDDGGTWTEQRPPGGTFGGSVTTIAVDPHDLERVFIATDAGFIWHTVDSGSTWTDLTGDFPSRTLPINALAVRSDTAANEPVLFAASAVGVWQSSGTTTNVHWRRFGDDFPDVNTTDIAFNQSNKYLVAGTYGRGVFANYLHYRTDVGPGACSLNNVVFTVAKDLDERICANQAQFGHAFSGWFELQGGGRTDAAPSICAIGNSIFVFVKGRDGKVYLNQAEFGHAFSGWFEVQGDGRTDAAPAATAIDRSIFVFVKGLNNRVLLNQAEFGHAFGDWFEVQGNGVTDRAPTAATIGSHVFVFVKGLDRKIYLNQADFGSPFGNWYEVQGNGHTDAAPSACSLNGSLFVAVKGLDQKIYLNQAEFGHAFSGWFEVQGDGRTDAAPSICAIGNSIFVFVKGLDGNVYLNQAEFGHAFSGWFEVGGGIY